MKRRSRLLFLTACFAASLMLSACSREASCEDPEVVDKMLGLAKRGVVKDLAGQCAARLYGKIPAVASQCPAGADGSTEGCVEACKTWAEANVTAKPGNIQTLFKDDLVATRRCRADVRFDVAFDGGQTVNASITYVAAPQTGGVQVALSD
ncbi:MAG: hypothetical protein ACKO42_04185 [Gammaproteobacteria bacterium]